MSVELASAASKKGARFLIVHLEDLGMTPSGHIPAGIWQLQSVRDLATDTGALSAAFYQGGPCSEGIVTENASRPTRFLGTIADLTKATYVGWRRFTKDGRDSVRLPSRCAHKHRSSIARNTCNGPRRQRPTIHAFANGSQTWWPQTPQCKR